MSEVRMDRLETIEKTHYTMSKKKSKTVAMSVI